jgi:transaldolase
MGIDAVTPMNFKVKIFADDADKAAMLELYTKPWINGFTTNPTLMRKAGVRNYEAFAREVLAAIPDRPISLEVFADEFSEMERQARLISSWADNVFVKIPVTNTRREPAVDLICRLSHAGVKLNVTALLTLAQVRDVAQALGGTPLFVSVFCRSDRGYWRRPRAAHGCRCRDRSVLSRHAIDLGQPARTVQRHTG